MQERKSNEIIRKQPVYRVGAKEFISKYQLGKLENKAIMLSGSTGMIGRFLIDVLMYKNMTDNSNIKILALGRTVEKGYERFQEYWRKPEFEFIETDINKEINLSQNAEFVLHLASSTHPRQYAENPIGTITSNIFGTYNLLNYAEKHNCERFLLASSVEVYGENKGDTEKFDEEYLGYIDCNTLRAGYPESKRASETLCQAFIKEKQMNVVIPRFSRVYGPTMLYDDSKALSQFIKKGVNHEDVVLKSAGNQLYSYSFVADAVRALLFILDKGKSGEAYNVADEKSDITLKELATIIAGAVDTHVRYELPEDVEKSGYSTATKALLDVKKIKALGWDSCYNIKEGLCHTIDILREVKNVM